MNDTLARRMDLTAMALSFVLAVLVTVVFHKKAMDRLRAVPLFFMVFGPMAIAVHMVLHLVGISYVAFLKWGAGTFTYDFRFYSLVLMAGVLFYLSFRLLQHSTTLLIGSENGTKARLIISALIVLVAAPTIPFTFIGSLPVQAVVINALAAFFVKKRAARKAMAEVPHFKNLPEGAAAL